LLPTLNLCSYKTCESLHKKGLDIFLQGNF
jgi:hypothetical protein